MGQAVAAPLSPDYGASTCRGRQAGFSDTQARSGTWSHQTQSAISGPGSMPCPSVNLLGNLFWGDFPWPSWLPSCLRGPTDVTEQLSQPPEPPQAGGLITL